MPSSITQRVAALRRRETIGLGLLRSFEYDEALIIDAMIKSGELAEDSALDDTAISAAVSRVLHAWATLVLAAQ